MRQYTYFTSLKSTKYINIDMLGARLADGMSSRDMGFVNSRVRRKFSRDLKRDRARIGNPNA